MFRWLSLFLILVICGSSWASGLTTWDRQKRETEADKPTGCIYYKFECADEACIETARNSLSSLICPPIGFECVVGSNGKHDCRGHSICVDNSGELLPKCPPLEEVYTPVGDCGEAEFQCKNKKCINEEELCNGEEDCTDGSDELEEICSHHFCPFPAFRCTYGGCVSGNVSCNGVIDCRDGSDEADSLCRMTRITVSGDPRHSRADRPPRTTGSCAIPAIENGRVMSPVTNEIYSLGHFAANGERLGFACLDGGLVGANETYCIDGSLMMEPPRCQRGCSTHLLDTISVRATCADKHLKTIPCTEIVPPSTVALPVCKTGYKKPKSFKDSIYCHEDGQWSNRIERCIPICGEITRAAPLISGGMETTISRVPWHVGVYELQEGKYAQICGGTIISQTAILSAAHCFWDENIKKSKDVNSFQILAGKTNRDYNLKDPGMQIFHVKAIDIPDGYYGMESVFGADIAVARLNTSIIYQTFISPICIPYYKLADKYVPHGTTGRVAGWGLNENNVGSPILKVIDLEAVDYRTCKNNVPKFFVPFVTPDKFCAALLSESVCQGDSGGGFAVAVNQQGVIKYYLRGLVSVGSKLTQMAVCEANRTYTTFTNVLFYDHWFNQFTQEQTKIKRGIGR